MAKDSKKTKVTAVTFGEERRVTVGLDLSDQEGRFAILLDSENEVVLEGSVRLTEAGLGGVFGSEPGWLVALEAGTRSAWVSRCLAGLGHSVLVANPRQVPLIYRSSRKNDRLDAIRLARLARFEPDLLQPIRHRGLQAQCDLGSLRTRALFVKARTGMVNSTRMQLKGVGIDVPSCSTETFAKTARPLIPPELMLGLGPLVDQIEHLTGQIKKLDKRIARLSEERYPETRLLRQVRGVGPITALAYLLTIEDAQRFESSRDVPAFLGLVPRQDDSGAHRSQLGITKAGDELVRRLLNQCAHYILGPFGEDSDLRRWGLRLMGNGENKKLKRRAVTAVSRKLAVLLHRLWVTGEVYDPLYWANQVGEAPAA
jgi:transposase